MKPCNSIFRAAFAATLMLAFLFGLSPMAHAQTTLLPKQTFSSSSWPDGWTDSYGYNSYQSDGSGAWFWNSDGLSAGDGAAMDDIWDYSSDYFYSPNFDATSYTAPGDSVWVDFDFFWEYNGYDYEYQYDFGYTMDYFEIDVNGANGTDFLAGGTTDQFYTYYNTSDYSWDVTAPGYSYWKHYHMLIPSYDLSSGMTISFGGYANTGLSDPAIDNVTVTGKAPGQELAVTPRTLNFGTATPNTPDTLFTTLSNIGILPLTIENIKLSGSTAYSIIAGSANINDVIQPGNSEQIGLQFQPFTNGVLNGVLTIATNGVDSGTQTVQLTGNGAVAQVSYSTNTMFRGTAIEVDSTSAPQYLYVSSTGNGPLLIQNVSFYGLDASAYRITHLPSGLIPSGVTDSIGVTFSPDLEGLPDAHMIITSTGVNDPIDTVLMDGVGILPHLAIAGPPDNVVSNIGHALLLNFDSVDVGTQTCMQVLLSNPGSDTVAILSNYLSGKDFDFTMTPIAGRDSLIPPGGTQSVQVCFTPLQRGYRTATLTINTDIPVTQSKPAQDTGTFQIQFIGTGVPTGLLSITGPTNDTLPVGTQGCVTDTFWNDGSAPIIVTNVAISGANASTFTSTSTPTPFTIQPNSHDVVTICATPAVAGSQNATLTATGNSGEAPINATLPLFAYGTSNSDTVVISTPLATICLPGTDTATISVENMGNIPASYTANISSQNGTDFLLLDSTASQPEMGGQSATFRVAFTPTATGTQTATIRIAGGAGGTINLLGIAGAATIAGAGVAPYTPIGQTSPTFTATVQNTGTCDWTPGVPQIFDSAEFTYVSGATTSIPAGSSGQLTFTYTPMAGGLGTATLAFPNQIGLSIPAAAVTLSSTPLDLVTATNANGFSLEQNYPNPFGNSSAITMTLPTASNVTLTVLDVTGKVVETVLDRHFDAGSYSVTLDAGVLASGTYYYQLSADGTTLIRKMVVAK